MAVTTLIKQRLMSNPTTTSRLWNDNFILKEESTDHFCFYSINYLGTNIQPLPTVSFAQASLVYCQSILISEPINLFNKNKWKHLNPILSNLNVLTSYVDPLVVEWRYEHYDVYEKDVEFVMNLKNEEGKDQIKAIDFLFEYIHHLIEKNAFFRIDAVIDLFISKSFKFRLSVAFLTITHSISSPLNKRGELLTYAKAVGKEEPLTEKQIDSILKGF